MVRVVAQPRVPQVRVLRRRVRRTIAPPLRSSEFLSTTMPRVERSDSAALEESRRLLNLWPHLSRVAAPGAQLLLR